MTQSVLMIVTSHNALGKTGKPTGLYLSELAHPYEVLVAAGLNIVVASPKGGDAPIDPNSLSPELEKFAPLASGTKALHSVRVEDYDAYLVVGGHGTMWDLAFNTDLERILPAALAQGKVVAAVCHGPVALSHLKNPDGTFVLRHKKVTGFTNDEESAAGLTEAMPFLLEDELIKAGAYYEKKPNWSAHVVVDDNLVTGQNPASAKGVGEAMVNLLCVAGGK
jgi:putative intracellular protease/amidase